MSKLFTQPICFHHPNGASGPIDPAASLSTLGGFAAAKNAFVGGKLTTYGGIEASGERIKGVGDARDPTDAVNLRLMQSLADNVTINTAADGKLQLAASAVSTPLKGGDGEPVTLDIDAGALAVVDGALSLARDITVDSINVGRISGLQPPTLSSDVVTRAYFDSHLSGLRVLPSVRACASSQVDLSLPLTGQSVDGVVLASGDRVLLTGQTAPIENGIWVVSSAGSTRAADLAAGSAAGNTQVYCLAGSINGQLTFVVTNASGADVVGTHPLVYTEFAGNGNLSAGNGLVQDGAALSVNVDVQGSGGLRIVNDVLELTPDQPRIRSLGGLSELSISSAVQASAVPTAPGHLTNKRYVDGLSYLQLGSGLTRTGDGAIQLAANVPLQDVSVSGRLQCAQVPTSAVDVVNRGYLSSLQWLGVDASFVKDTSSQVLRLAPVQTGITAVGTLNGLDVSGPVTCSAGPTLSSHLTRKSYVDALGYLQTGPGLSLSAGRISLNPVQTFTDLSVLYNVVAPAVPTLSTHLTNKAYVDGAIRTRVPSAATYSGNTTRASSGRLSFSTTIAETQPYSQDMRYVRNSQSGDTWTVLTSGVYSVTATVQLTSQSGPYALMREMAEVPDGVQIVCGAPAAGPSSLSFVGYLEATTVLYLMGASIDPVRPSFVWLSRL